MQNDKEFEQLQDLKRRFAYMFRGPNLGFDFYRGWLQDFIDACVKIDALLGDDKRGFHFTQIKEKYAWARYYFETAQARPMRVSVSDGKGVHERMIGLKDGDSVETMIAEIVNDAEEKSMRKCIVCGSPAEVRKIHGWLISVCQKHEQADSERGENFRAAHIRERPLSGEND